MDHWALLMMKDPEPQLLQETPLPSITRRRHPARSPETYMLADYCWYCSCAADSPPAGFIVPAPLPPESVEPSGAWEEAEGFVTRGPDACGSGAADAEADTEAGDAVAGADAGADAEAGTS